MEYGKFYQISTLQALAMGYTKPVCKVSELLEHGDSGLGTFANVNGEMIVAGGHCYKAAEDGSITETEPDEGVPFASVAFLNGDREFDLADVPGIGELKKILDLRIEEWFGLNSMHIVRIDGLFKKVSARSEAPYESQHVELKDILSETQKSFAFTDIKGTMICVYYPDYMDGINAPGWHLHFISDDRKSGGHVFDLELTSGTAMMDKLPGLEIRLPSEPSFDTYSLKEASQNDIKQVEQGKKK